MSTKTTFKRVALVAVAALGFGMLSVVPSSATATTGILTCTNASTIADTGACTGIAGSLNYVGLSLVQGGSGTQYVITVTGGTASTSATTISGSGTATLFSTSTGAFTATITVPTPTAGTITVKQFGVTNGVVASTATDTVVITVSAALAGSVYASTLVTPSVPATAGNAFQYTNAATTVVTRIARAAAPSTDELFSFALTQKDAAGTALGTPYTKAVTASLTGVGSLSMAMTTPAQAGTQAVSQYAAAAAGGTNDAVVNVYADGRAGKSTLTIAVNGVTVKTYDFTFWGSVASYKLTLNQNQVPVSGTSDAFTVTALDSLGTAVPNAAWFASSSSTATATTATVGPTTNTCTGGNVCTVATEFAALGSSDVSVAALAKGSATFTVADKATSPTITATTTVKVTGAQIATLTWAANKISYAPGEKVTVTMTAKDSDGNPVGDKNYIVWKAAPSASLSTNGLVSDQSLVAPTTAEDFVDGVASYSFYAPITSGAFTFSATTSKNADLAVALQGLAQSLALDVTNVEAQAAIDAAAEATDAANAATDAANAAAEAADAATAAAQDAADAVAALSAQVATLISALKAQLTSLTNLVIKIQKKVKA